MTDAHKQLSLADLALPPKRGRPKSGNALSNADKQREYRRRLKAAGSVHSTFTHEELAILAGLLIAASSAEPLRVEDIRKLHGTQLEPLRAKVTAMQQVALDNAYQAMTPSKPKRKKNSLSS